MKRIASLITLIAFAPLMMAATPAPDAVCAKVVEAERQQCTDAMTEFARFLDEAQWKTFSDCLLKHDPLTQAQAMACFTPDLQKAMEEKMMKEMEKMMQDGSGTTPPGTPPAPAPAPTGHEGHDH